MSTLKVGGIRGTGASSDAITVNASDGTATGKFTNLPNRNLIINGAMLVAQRATSSTSHGLTTVDRISTYETNTDAGTKTWSQADITSGGAYDVGFRKAFKIATSQAGNTSNAAAYMSAYATKLEAQDIANSGWKYTDPNSKVTLSFWIKASTADNFQLQLVTDDGTKKKYNTTVAATTSWTKITRTIPGHADLTFTNDNGKGLTVQLIVATGSDMAGTVTQNAWGANTVAAVAADQINTWLAAGAGTIETTGWQLEVGDVATDFEHRTYADELIRCMRYYQKLTFGADIPGNTTGTSVVTCVSFNSSNAYGGFPAMVPFRSGGTDIAFSHSTVGGSGHWGYLENGSDKAVTDIDDQDKTTTKTISLLVQGSLDDHVGTLRATHGDAYLAWDNEL